MKFNHLFTITLLIVLCACNSLPKPQLISYTDSLKLRDSATVNSNVISYLHQSTPVIYLDEKGDSLIASIEGNLIFEPWLKVKTITGTTGWVFSGGLDFDSTQANYGRFDSTKIAIDSILFVPLNKTIPVYPLPQLSSKKLFKITGLTEIIVKGQDTTECPITGIQRVWVKSEDEHGKPIYILRSNLNKKIKNEISLEKFEQILTDKYDVTKGDEGYEFKSLKRFLNGDDGAEWTEESELTFDFDGKNIKMGYMYMYTSIEIRHIIKNGNKYTFGVNSVYAGNNKEFELVLNNSFIKVNNAGELSVKYVPGKADNY